MKTHGIRAFALVSITALAVLQAPLAAQLVYQVSVIAQTGDEPPGRPGESFTSFSDPCLDDLGRLVFKGNFDGPLSGNEGVYVHDVALGTLTRVVDDSFDFSPPGQGGATSWTSFGPPVSNGAGDTGFWGTFSFGDNSQGVYLFGAGGNAHVFDDAPAQVVPGQPTAVGFTTFPFGAGVVPVFGAGGHAASVATFFDAGFVQHNGLYLGDTTTGIVRVADDTLVPPGQAAAARFDDFDLALALNASGDLVFRALTSGGTSSDGLYHYDRSSAALSKLADMRTGVPGLGATGFSGFEGTLSFNDAGDAVFRGSFAGGEGIYRGSPGALSAVVDDTGAFAVPGHPGKSFESFGSPVIGAQGHVAFFADFGPALADGGVFRWSSGAGLECLFSFADPVPGQPGANFSALGNLSMSADGSVAMTVRYQNGVGNEGVYVHDGSQLRRVLDESDSTLGLSLDNLHMLLFTGGSGGQDGRPRTLATDGSVTFRASLLGGGEAILLGEPTLSGPELVPVAAADVQPGGPAYDFEIGRFEITNAQFAAFLNDAEFHNEIQNPGFGSELGDHLVWRPSPNDFGDVGIEVGDTFSVKVFDISRSLLTYSSALPVGTRYGVAPDRGTHAATGMSWIGAAKYCNWLTLTEGLGLDERVYAEGASEFDWFPVTIGSEIGGTQQSTYAVRDLTLSERAELVQELRGYRLPMDQGGLLVGSENAVARPYNEWFKAAAFDPAAPDVPRVAFPGSFEEHVVPADHWIHGFGRDPLFNADANFRDSGDPFDDPDPDVYATAPAGYYDGSLQGGVFQTTADANHFGLFDVSGSVWEFLTDQVDITDSLTPDRSIVGGSYRSNVRQVAVANRGDIGPDSTRPVVGLRVLRVSDAPDPDAAWTDIGQGLAGSGGVQPALVGSGPLIPGSSTSLALSDALPGSTTTIVLGFSTLNAPLKGGVLVPALDLVLFNKPVNGAGVFAFSFAWPEGIPSGTEFFLQEWIVDAGGPSGFAASNALRGVTP